MYKRRRRRENRMPRNDQPVGAKVPGSHTQMLSDLAHGWERVYRVYHLALHSAEQEHADGLIVGMAALLQDLGRTTRGPMRSHAERSAKLAQKLLVEYDLPHDTCHAILSHSYRHGIEPATLEARVLYDADRLDSLGASGVMRWAMTAKHGRLTQTRTYYPDDPFALWCVPDGQHYLLDRFLTKLLQLQEAMTTAKGGLWKSTALPFCAFTCRNSCRN
jgi:uncharacterized protein